MAGLRKLVPWADRQAIVAAIDAISDRLTEFARDRSLAFDGEVGNTTPRIELVGRREGGCRAGVEAGLARAAVIAIGFIARQIGIGEDRAEEQPRAELARHEVGMLALPAQARGLGQGFFPPGR